MCSKKEKKGDEILRREGKTTLPRKEAFETYEGRGSEPEKGKKEIGGCSEDPPEGNKFSIHHRSMSMSRKKAMVKKDLTEKKGEKRLEKKMSLPEEEGSGNSR